MVMLKEGIYFSTLKNKYHLRGLFLFKKLIPQKIQRVSRLMNGMSKDT